MSERRSLTDRIRSATNWKRPPVPPTPALDQPSTWLTFSTSGEYPTTFAICPACCAVVQDKAHSKQAHIDWHKGLGK